MLQGRASARCLQVVSSPVVTCTLRIGDRVVLSSSDGAPEVEYALFDSGEIELAATGPGMVQEVGYQTTADEALGRLADAGVTWEVVLEASAAMQPTLTMIYARGGAVRRIATLLSPAELFDGFRFDPAAKEYEGRWLDLPALGKDLDFPRFTQAAQAIHLVALLREVNPGDPVRLVTRELMATARKGGRSYRRGMVPVISELPTKLEILGEQYRDSPNPPPERTAGPTMAEMLEVLRDRIVLTPDPETQERLHAIEKGVAMRQKALRGPLTDPELWALDEQLSAGKHEGVVELLDALDMAKGKQPATAYLRVRAAFISGREDPHAVAERIDALALTMPSFVELELLAAEAWTAAGEPKRALPFARDLNANAAVNDELRARESRRDGAARPSQGGMEAVKPAPRPKTLPLDVAGDEAPAATPHSPVRSSASSERPNAHERVTPPPPAPSPRPRATPGPLDAKGVSRSTQPLPTGETPSGRTLMMGRPSTNPPRISPLPQPASARRETPPMMFGVEDPNRPAQAFSQIPTTRNPGKRQISGTWVGPPPAGVPGSMRPNAGPFTAPPVGDGDRVTPTPSENVPATRATSRPSPDVPRLANRSATELMRGASQPPFRSDSPEAHTHVPRAPAVPRFDDEAEAAAALTLPEGLSGVPDPIETLPRTVLDARVQFTFLARELGREYDEQLGVVLRADISGIEAIQRVLLERYKTRSVATPEAAGDIRRHGAFLSEILARSFGAFWVDIGPSDVGYWAMLVPPGTRVWPFGRILRLIAMQHNERDLVSYFLELQARSARG